MEVPHHHGNGHGSKKGWKTYFSEFFMLFLAVFCGFIAENIRENFVEKERAHQYAASMIADVQKDTTQIDVIIRLNRKLIKGIDSLLFYLKAPVSEAVSKKIYTYSNVVGASILYESVNGTITQLKNAGGFRLIKDTACVNSISSYDLLNEGIKKQGDAYYRSTMELLDMIEQLLDFSVTTHPDNPVYYINRDENLLRRFYNKSFVQKQIITSYCAYLEQQKKLGAKTIAVLKKNYHTSE